VTDQRIVKWRRWLDQGITSDVYTMHLERFAWDRMAEIIRENADLKETVSYLWEWMFDVYTKTQAGAVRRQADIDRQVASLGRLIYEIEKTPTLLTRDWYIGLWNEGDDDAYWCKVAEDHWTEEFGGLVGDHFDPAIAGEDLVCLRDGSERVRRYVDQHVAHFDARTIAPTRKGSDLPTLNEVHNAIDLIGDLFKKYGHLLTAAGWGSLTPVIQHDWEKVFRMQWLSEAEVPGSARKARDRRAARETQA
jgi:hypothetical protein